jgi:hypothetical protein
MFHKESDRVRSPERDRDPNQDRDHNPKHNPKHDPISDRTRAIARTPDFDHDRKPAPDSDRDHSIHSRPGWIVVKRAPRGK